MQKLPGITQEAEEQKLQQTIAIADEKLTQARQSMQSLADELHEMLEVFDTKDKEAMTLWNNTNSMFRQVGQNMRRAEQARRKPYFGRIDFTDKKIGHEEVYYIGRSAIVTDPAHPEVIDWRAPVSSVYYDAGLGEASYSVRGEGSYKITLSRKRTYEIEDDHLKAFYDSDVVANDDLLTKYLAKNKNAVLGNIIATIQQEQNEVIRKKPQHNLIIQGAAGSGKTTVAMHRISYILYNYELEYPPEDFYIIGSNQMLLNYITSVLPELDVYGVSQMTMEQLFIRLLYEDWDKRYRVKPIQKGVTPPVRGTLSWFRDLENYCERYERSVIPLNDVRIEKNGVLLLSKKAIEDILSRSTQLSRADKITRLTEHLTAKLENELSGKYYSYTNGEKLRLTRYYKTYFGKREWKGSIFELYHDFLLEQIEKGISVELPDTVFDVYDLAALAYLYKRIKESDIIREAGHVIIDEAQDFGMMAYSSLKYCLSKCTYTIMGDISQNISLDYGLNDWTELKELMLPDPWDYFGLLRKSYRNTVEISHFATDILYHGSFPLYPVEPIIRHGKEVRIAGCTDFDALLTETADTIQKWLQSGYETIAVICAAPEEAAQVSDRLRASVPLADMDQEHMEFRSGVMVLSLENTKGLEFDAVLLFDISEEHYPAEDGYVKRLYVAATRALHEMVVLYQGTLTPLIADPVPEEKRRKAILTAEPPRRTSLPPEPEKTAKELFREKALEGEWDMARRRLYGPRRIVADHKPQMSTNFAKKISEMSDATRSEKKLSGMPDAIRSIKEPVKRTASVSASPSPSKEFARVPEAASLRPPGHSRIDCSVRFVQKGNGWFDLTSSYGTLRIAPIAQDIIRVCFAAGTCSRFPEALPEYAGQLLRYKKRETPAVFELLTEKLLVHVDKKTGALSFYTPQQKLLLSERPKEPRQIEGPKVWMFFDWTKEEKLTARGLTDKQPVVVGTSFAKYISFGETSRRSPGLHSQKGYELIFPPKMKVLCCKIPMYGPYVSMEGTNVIDYYFKTM